MFCRTRNRRKNVDNKKFIVLSLCLLISLIIFYLLINFVYNKFKVKSNFEKLCNIPVNVEVASEFRYRDPLINEKTLCIFQSSKIKLPLYNYQFGS